jgi:hypothetical protein
MVSQPCKILLQNRALLFLQKADPARAFINDTNSFLDTRRDTGRLPDHGRIIRPHLYNLVQEPCDLDSSQEAGGKGDKYQDLGLMPIVIRSTTSVIFGFLFAGTPRACLDLVLHQLCHIEAKWRFAYV